MGITAAEARSLTADEQSELITKTYTHLVLAIAAFIGIESWLFSSGRAQVIYETMIGVSWLWVLGGFVLVSWIASWAAHTLESRAAQYGALLLAVVAQAVILVRLLYPAVMTDTDIVGNAAAVTLVGFAILTAIVLRTRRNFSFLRPFLLWVGLGVIALIVLSLLFGFQLGQAFSIGMVIYAGGAVLYSTSNVLHQYRPGQHVAAALELFASIALLFWYVMRLYSDD
jgi:FtsH-binding integral membrane protein